MNGISIFRVVLWVHIFVGAIALFVAPAAMVTVKGGQWHRRWGKIYFWSITVVAMTAVVMSFIRSGLFFLLVALFSFYLAFTGYRVLSRKTPQQRPGKRDWAAAFMMIFSGVTLVAYGIYQILTLGYGIVPIVFGGIGSLFGVSDMRDFRHHPADKMAWWYSHMVRMLSAYIATVTAFSVVNFHFLPPVVRWLWATVAGTVGIVIWTGYYRKGFSGARPAGRERPTLNVQRPTSNSEESPRNLSL